MCIKDWESEYLFRSLIIYHIEWPALWWIRIFHHFSPVIFVHVQARIFKTSHTIYSDFFYFWSICWAALIFLEKVGSWTFFFLSLSKQRKKTHCPPCKKRRSHSDTVPPNPIPTMAWNINLPHLLWLNGLMTMKWILWP